MDEAPASSPLTGRRVTVGAGLVALAVVCCAVPGLGVACAGGAVGVLGGLELARSRRVRWAIAALLVVAAGLFAVGVAVERSHDRHPATVAAKPEGSAEGSTEHEAAEGGVRQAAPETTERTVLGVDTESTGVVVLVVALSVLLAGLVVVRPGRGALAATVAGAAAAAIFDLAEYAHQRHLGEQGLARLALAVAALHISAAVVAGLTWWAAQKAAHGQGAPSNQRDAGLSELGPASARHRPVG